MAHSKLAEWRTLNEQLVKNIEQTNKQTNTDYTVSPSSLPVIMQQTLRAII